MCTHAHFITTGIKDISISYTNNVMLLQQLMVQLGLLLDAIGSYRQSSQASGFTESPHRKRAWLPVVQASTIGIADELVDSLAALNPRLHHLFKHDEDLFPRRCDVL